MPALYPRLWRYALSLSSDRALAEDLAQETVLQGLAKSEQFNPGTHVDRWMFRILHRLWLNRMRADRVRMGAGLVPVDEAGLVAKDNPEETFFGTEVLSAVSDLPGAQRAAVLLVYVEGFAYAEAAALLEVPVGTIMSRLAAARTKLKDRLGDRG